MKCLQSSLVWLLNGEFLNTGPSFEHAFVQCVFLCNTNRDMFCQFYSTLQNYLILMQPCYNAVVVKTSKAPAS